jgi:hypothetical protein
VSLPLSLCYRLCLVFALSSLPLPRRVAFVVVTFAFVVVACISIIPASFCTGGRLRTPVVGGNLGIAR